jgi:hypothetical protein
MGNLVFQATLGGQVNLVGPNTASTYNLNVPAVAGTLVTTGDTGTVTNTMLASNVYTAPGTIGSVTPNTGAFTTLSASGNITASGGTANGVPYLNASKVLTSGSALVFDGTRLGVGSAAAASTTLDVYGESQHTYLVIRNGAQTNPGYTSPTLYSPASGQLGFGLAASEQMRLTSTGLGIGTSSPGAKLHVTSGAVGVQALFSYSSGTPTIAVGNSTTNYNLQLGYNVGSEYGYIQATAAVGVADDIVINPNGGNLGLGVTPKSWISTYNVFQVGLGASISGRNTTYSQIQLGCNYYVDSSGQNTYIGSDYASRYYQSSGAHIWNTAASGTAGTAITFTQAMTLDASGNLALGNTSPQARFHTKAGAVTQGAIVETGGSNAFLSFADAGTSSYTRVQIGSAGNNFVTYINGSEAARIDTSGNLLVGATSTSGTNGFMVIPASPAYAIVAHPSGTTSGYAYMSFQYAGSAIGSITQSGTTAVLYNVTSDQRLKQNIIDAPEFGSVIDAIQVRSYDWKADGNHQRAGFIAQELVNVAPEAVHQPVDSEEMMAVDYSKLVPMLVKEIQSLRKRLATLEAK